MGKLKKIGLIVLISLLSLFFLTVFVLINLPYDSIIERIDHNIARKQGAHLTVHDVRYRFPFRFFLDEIRVSRDDGSFDIKMDRMILRLRIRAFSRWKTLQIEGFGLEINSDIVELSKGRFILVSRLLLPFRGREFRPEMLRALSLKSEGLNIDRVFISGFEFTSLKVPLVDISLINEEENGFVLERGLIRSNFFQSEISGRFDFQRIDGQITLSLTGEFFKTYSNLKALVDSVADNGVLTLTVRGNTLHPVVQLTRRR
jgi:hypothetical protein